MDGDITDHHSGRGVRPADTPRRSGRILVAAAAAIALVAGLLGGVIAY